MLLRSIFRRTRSSGCCVRDAARIDVSLRGRIAAGASDECAGGKASGWQRRAGDRRNLVVTDRDGGRQRDIARIRDPVAVGDRRANRAERSRRRALCDRQRR